MLRHAIPYAGTSTRCGCPVQPPCGGITPADGFPAFDHRRKNPAMESSRADSEDCQRFATEARR